jgi:hypothetical protein
VAISEVSFLTQGSRELHAAEGLKWLQFTVVNDNSPEQIFENLPQLIMTSEDSDIFVENFVPVERQLATREMITGSDFRIIYTNYEDADHPDQQLIKNSNQSSPEYPLTIENVYQYIVDAGGADVPVVYTKQFFTPFEGELDCIWVKDDNTEWAWRCRSDDLERFPLSKVNNIPIMPSALGRPRTYNNCKTICIMPLNYSDRFKFAPGDDDIYKFDVYTIASGASVNTKVFSDSTGYGLLHVVKGAVEIAETAVEFQQFYKQDPRESTTITATTDALVVFMAKVPSM